MNEATALQVQETPRALRPIGEIIADLSKPLDAKHLKTRRQGGTELTYIEWHTAVKYLDLFAPGWNYHVPSVQLVGNLVTVVASISIPCAEGSVTREATGCEESDAKGYGDALSNSEAMALKRAASKFGLGLYLYDKDGKAAPETRQQQGQRQAEIGGDPRAKTLGDIVSPKQLWMIRSMAKEQGVDPEQMAQDLLKCKLEETSKKSASVLIDALKNKEAAMPAPPITTSTGPSKALMKNPKHSPEMAKRLGELVQQLVIRKVAADEMLREVNVALHDSNLKQVQSRYEMDDQQGEIACNTFKAWIAQIDRAKPKDIGI